MPTHTMAVTLMCEGLYQKFLEDFNMPKFPTGSRLDLAQRQLFAQLAEKQMARILDEQKLVDDLEAAGFKVIVLG